MIPVHILKDLAEELSPILTEIFRRTLAEGEVPMEWHSANVSAIFKKGDRFKASNYRPVSLTSQCCIMGSQNDASGDNQDSVL